MVCARAVFNIVNQWLDRITEEGELRQEALSPVPDRLEDLCELGFLRKIIGPKNKVSLWYCLKNQRPDGKGKPILMADGRDLFSIQTLCGTCKQGFVWHEQRSKMGKARAAIQRFGNMEIEAIINCCIHPANNAIQINLGKFGSFYCTKTDERASMTGDCMNGQCEYFFKTSAPLYVKDTDAFDEVQKVLRARAKCRLVHERIYESTVEPQILLLRK